MTAITEANAKKIIKSLPFFRQMSKHGMEGWYKFLTNFDDTTGAIASVVGAALAGTTGAAFETDTDGTVPALALGSQAAGTGDYTLTLKPATTLTGNADVIIPDGADTFCMIAATQTLTNKTLTTPTIASFTNATHDHSTAAQGGTLSSALITGTSADTFTINTGASTPQLNISTTGSTGDYTMILQVPIIGAAATITLPALTGTLATIGGTETLTAKTLTTPTLTTPAIATGLTASGSASNNFGSSTGAFVTSSGANTLSGDVTVAAGKNLTLAVGAGIITANGATSGSIVISPTATGTNATTLVNQGGGSAKTITLPSVTGTLAILGANTFSGAQTFGAATVFGSTVDLQGNVSTSTGNPTFIMSASSGAFTTSTGTNTLSGNVVISGTKTLTTGTGAVILNGDVTIKASIDTLAAGAAMTVGAANATSLAIGASDITTSILGATTILGSLDTTAAAAMTVAPAVATSLALGATDIVTTLKGIVQNDATEASGVVYCEIIDVITADINTGKVIVTVPAGLQFQLVNLEQIAYGGAAGTATAITVAGSATLTSTTIGALTENTLVRLDTANVTTLAAGASFTAQTDGTDITVAKTGGDLDTCTGVRFILSYMLV